MEDFKLLRRWGKLTRFVCSEDENKNWFLAIRDKMRGLDYKSQEKVVEELSELYEEALHSEAEHMVYTCTCTLYYWYVYYLHV